jgi:predicted Zn-dependent protease
MKYAFTSLLLALALLVPAAHVPAQRSVPVTERPASRPPARPPVLPGIPTTAENCHLPTEWEVRAGRDGSAEVEKHYKILTSGEYHERLQRVAAPIAEAALHPELIAEYRRRYRLPRSDDRARRVPFEFSFKVIDEPKEMNAFALPAGPIYVTTALLDSASDDELAAVLAHEAVHVTFHHAEKHVAKRKKLQPGQLLGLAAAAIGMIAGGPGTGDAAMGILLGSQLLAVSAMTGYGQELEAEADEIGVRILTKTQYHPAGMVTFMRKLMREEQLRGSPDLGVFRTHPYSNQRVAAIQKEVSRQGFEIDRSVERRVGSAFRIETISQRLDGREAAELRLNGHTLFVVLSGEAGMSPRERARFIAEQIEALFVDNLTLNDVRKSPDEQTLLLKGIPVIRAFPEDAEVLDEGASAVVDRAYREIKRALVREKLDIH